MTNSRACLCPCIRPPCAAPGAHTRSISVATPSSASGGIMRFAKVGGVQGGARALAGRGSELERGGWLSWTQPDPEGLIPDCVEVLAPGGGLNTSHASIAIGI